MTAVGMAEGTTDEAAEEDTRRTVAADVMTATVAVEVVTIVAVTVVDTVRWHKALLPEQSRRAFRKKHWHLTHGASCFQSRRWWWWWRWRLLWT
jgi:hypothetical protein